MTRLYVATTNAGKLRELAALFDSEKSLPGPFDVVTFRAYESPREGDTSYADNAALKARALHAQLQAAGRVEAVLADDSGLEVAALGGRPGVVTADYGGPAASWPQRRALLLEEIAGTGGADRRARFVCALHYIGVDGRELATWATVEGEIARAEFGTLGFSFDPIFFYPALAKTFAQIRDAEKNGFSHRGVAALGLIAMLRATVPSSNIPRPVFGFGDGDGEAPT